ncbi:MAG TPA: right-handed parallel beta-helix repeat-containing protein [Gaiellaceae bacterium]
MVRLFVVAGLAVAGIVAAVAYPASRHAGGVAVKGPSKAPSVCTHYASTAGNDRGPGTKARPFLTAQRLVSSLRPGATGCFLGGRYVQDVTIRHGGTDTAPITIRSAPGDSAVLQGRLWIADSANWVVVTHLQLDGRNDNLLPSPTIDGDHVTFSYDSVTNNKMGGLHDGDGICFDLGDSTGHYGYAYGTRIVHDRIHDCGTSDNHNHGIYVAGSYNAVITDNWIYDNGDRGIQLYPDAHNTLIERNIIAGNGEGVIFSGDETHASSGNILIHNVIVGSTIRHNVEYWWPGPVGTNNVVKENCIYGGHTGNILQPSIGYSIVGNLIVAPKFVAGAQLTGIKPKTACAAFAPR